MPPPCRLHPVSFPHSAASPLPLLLLRLPMLMHCQSHPKSNARRIVFNSSCSAYASLDRAKTENSSMTMAVAVAVVAATWRWAWHWQNFDIHAHLYFSFPLLIFRLIADGAVWIWLLLDGWLGVGRYLGSFEAQGTHSVASFLHAFNSTFFCRQTYYLPTALDYSSSSSSSFLFPSRLFSLPEDPVCLDEQQHGKGGVACQSEEQSTEDDEKEEAIPNPQKRERERERERNQDNNQKPIQNNQPTAVVHISLRANFAPIK
ncbi:uncharacterized protein IWZ02DRAFT_226191 [Phyllosticta citriasiana]|uniref:uncharacterized protein n=1 Tax=Phyllosticta citriasiana TaxID=595635 RepID=UPI0030FD414B